MALEEIKYAKEGAHEIVIVNDSLDWAYALFREVALALGVKTFGDDSAIIIGQRHASRALNMQSIPSETTYTLR
jgi:hypothetical protein